MWLPHCDQAIVPTAKLMDYLLSDTHPVGRTKSKFLKRLGFDRNQSMLLQTALLNIAHHQPVVTVQSSPYGEKYVVDGTLCRPHSSEVVRTVWIVEKGSEEPRLVTVYPSLATSSTEE